MISSVAVVEPAAKRTVKRQGYGRTLLLLLALISLPLRSSVEPFDLANLAVGGTWPGHPDEATPFPSAVEIDHIRVYKRAR
jgi:hypothetical protein